MRKFRGEDDTLDAAYGVRVSIMGSITALDGMVWCSGVSREVG